MEPGDYTSLGFWMAGARWICHFSDRGDVRLPNILSTSIQFKMNTFCRWAAFHFIAFA